MHPIADVSFSVPSPVPSGILEGHLQRLSNEVRESASKEALSLGHRQLSAAASAAHRASHAGQNGTTQQTAAQHSAVVAEVLLAAAAEEGGGGKAGLVTSAALLSELHGLALALAPVAGMAIQQLGVCPEGLRVGNGDFWRWGQVAAEHLEEEITPDLGHGQTLVGCRGQGMGFKGSWGCHGDKQTFQACLGAPVMPGHQCPCSPGCPCRRLLPLASSASSLVCLTPVRVRVVTVVKSRHLCFAYQSFS